MKNESEYRQSVELTCNQPTAPVVANLNQLILYLVKQMLFDVIIPGREMFSENKINSLKEQIMIFKFKYLEGSDEQLAYQQLVKLSKTAPNYEKGLRELANVYLGAGKEIQDSLTREIAKSCGALETFTGQIVQVDDKRFDIQWECYRSKLYIRTMIDIFSRLLQMANILKLILLPIFEQVYQSISLTVYYNIGCLTQEFPSSYKYQIGQLEIQINFTKTESSQ